MVICESCKDKIEGNYVVFVYDGSEVFCSRECLNDWINDKVIMTSAAEVDEEEKYAYEERKGEMRRGK